MCVSEMNVEGRKTRADGRMWVSGRCGSCVSGRMKQHGSLQHASTPTFSLESDEWRVHRGVTNNFKNFCWINADLMRCELI